jgi:hypothetical protein
MAERQQAAAVPEPTDDVPEIRDAAVSSDYVLPVVHVHVPDALMNAGFWGGLAGAVVLGAVDLPLGVLVGAAVVVARHHR